MRFSDILGHEKPLNIINAYIEKSCFSGGYIFSGPEGIGKKTVAKIIAQKLNCTAQIDRPCGSCSSCLKIEKLRHPDLHIIENDASQIKIEDIRNLQREASFRPYEGVMKVFIIDDAHRLNPEAANSLLKVLEESPGGSLIILITHKLQNIFKTILSRCKVIRFSPLAITVLEDILIKDYLVDRLFARFISFYAEGRLGLAVKLKDSKVFEEKNRIFDSFVLSGKPLDRNFTGQSREQLRGCLNILASWFRDIYLLKAGISDRELIHLDRENDLLKLIHEFSFKQLDGILTTISESIFYLENNINSKLLLHNLGVQLWKA
ncbi:MAG: DNA polymerase III subunit delta' [Candidatus Omnitrophica bacterium]|nr:DNA polymerase III subunit delta' [Candidatus Omnitrophota bacterium]MBU1922665.1 DNA polymerase III subunit delta' [Candidatus Omnitrophota bacterium]